MHESSYTGAAIAQAAGETMSSTAMPALTRQYEVYI